jgi:PAS domain S-box-containing protein
MDRRVDDEPSGSECAGRLLLAVDDDHDRELLAEWLGSFPQYEVVLAAEPGDVGEFDLCLCDGRTVREFAPTLAARQQEADPVFLPCVVLVSDAVDTPAEDIERAVERETSLDIQALVTMPVDQTDLQRRLDNLLRARDASLRLAERKQQYEGLVRLAPEAILLLRDDRVIYANESAAALLGHDTPVSLSEESLSTYVPEGDSAVGEVLDTIDARGSTDSYVDGRVLSRDGRTLDVKLGGVEVVFEGEPATQLILRDVTAERERERQLTLFERAIETARQGITIADARQEDLPLVYVNEAFERITGYSAPECLGCNCRFLQGPGTDQETVDTVRQALEEHSPVSVELLNYRKDGTPFWNKLDIVPVRDGETVTHFLGLQQDVTGRVEREQRLSVLDRILRHNLRNRGNVIRAHADRIRRGEADPPAEAADRIVGAVDELLELSDHVRRFRSIIVEEESEPVVHDVVAVLERAIEGWEGVSSGRGVALDHPESALVRAHPMFPLALGELLRKFAGSDGTPTVRVRREDDRVVVEFADCGRVFSESDIEVVRQSRETPVAHSQGLEVWLVRWVVAVSDGKLSVVGDGDGPRTLRLSLPEGDGDG